MTRTGESSKRQTRQQFKPISAGKILEVSFWGTVFWSLGRLILHFLHFTPFGLGTYAHSFLLARGDERTLAGVTLGIVVLFFATLLASVLYSLVFSRARIWWTGLLYGALLLVLFGVSTGIQNWRFATLSTEAAWFLTYGLFIGMSLSLEQTDLQKVSKEKQE
mgnify:CR=1 FL=1